MEALHQIAAGRALADTILKLVMINRVVVVYPKEPSHYQDAFYALSGMKSMIWDGLIVFLIP